MKLIYQNFDKLEITFQGALPEKILSLLAEAREMAQNEKREVLIEIGRNHLPVMVAETGSPGGYRYRFDTGPDGETWSIAHSTNPKNWNIRVSVKSLALALHGYEALKATVSSRLNSFEAAGCVRFDPASGASINTPLERISRFDYCFDFASEARFDPLPSRFVAHQRTGKHVYAAGEPVDKYSSLNGDRVNTIRLGKMPGREATLYNKTKELAASSKHYWWDIWAIDPQSFKSSGREIWRVEVRAGRDELDKWGIKRFKDFESKAGDVVAGILKAMRYTEPLKDDANRSRWPMHPLWQDALKASLRALAPYSSGACREKIIRDYRENVINGHRQNITGNLISLTAAMGREASAITSVIRELQGATEEMARKDTSILIKKHARAKERFRFLL